MTHMFWVACGREGFQTRHQYHFVYLCCVALTRMFDKWSRIVPHKAETRSLKEKCKTSESRNRYFNSKSQNTAELKQTQAAEWEDLKPQ